jgi:hypothetical protein
MRYMKSLENKDISLVHSMIALVILLLLVSGFPLLYNLIFS